MNTDVNNPDIFKEWNGEFLMVAFRTRNLGGSDGPVSAQPRRDSYNHLPAMKSLGGNSH